MNGTHSIRRLGRHSLAIPEIGHLHLAGEIIMFCGLMSVNNMLIMSGCKPLRYLDGNAIVSLTPR